MSTAQRKVLVFVGVTLGLWRAFQIPAVNQAFWLFCTAGVIPGTDRTLSPEMVMKLLIMTFPLALLIIFRKEFIAAAPRLRPALAHDVAQPKSSKLPRRHHKNPVVITVPAKAKKRRIKTAVNILGHSLRFASIHAAVCLQKQSKTIWNLATRTAVLLGVLAVRFWHWSEPYIRQFDHWLNVTLHKNKTVSGILDIGSESQKAISSLSQRALKRYYK